MKLYRAFTACLIFIFGIYSFYNITVKQNSRLGIIILLICILASYLQIDRTKVNRLFKNEEYRKWYALDYIGLSVFIYLIYDIIH